MLYIASAIFSVVVLGQIVACLGVDAPIQMALSAHNEARAAEDAGLPDVTWDGELYDLCVRNVQLCTFAHDVTQLADGSPYGQNLYARIGYLVTADQVMTDAVNAWMAEKTDYDIETNVCTSGQVCGHYTQVVWQTSVRIGCAVNSQCGAMTIVCCNYAPPGNYVGMKPYELPEPVDGGWGDWSDWTVCSLTCGIGQRTRTRTCDSPIPQYDGLACSGPGTETGACNQGSCIYVPPCQLCESDAGVCVDSDGDNSTDSCQCPIGKCSSSFTNGCDSDCALVDKECDYKQPVPCWDVNSECGSVWLLSTRRRFCACKPGYVEVREEAEMTQCRRIIDTDEDSACLECVTNSGICYGTDGVKDGCICTSDRISINAECDTKLFEISCDEDGMTVCYSQINQTSDMYARLDSTESALFVKDHFNSVNCRAYKNDSGIYCTSLMYHGLSSCGFRISRLLSEATYSQTIVLQTYADRETLTDVHLSASCIFDMRKKIVSGCIQDRRSGNRIPGTEGQRHVATLAFSVLGLGGKDLEKHGIPLGKPMKLRISMIDDDDGLYESIRAEVCLLSDSSRLLLPTRGARSVMMVMYGCPIGLLTGQQLSIDDDLRVVETDYFQSVFFHGTAGYIYIHCAVRLCLDRIACLPKDCGLVNQNYLDGEGLDMTAFTGLPGIQFETAAMGLVDEEVADVESAGTSLPGTENFYEDQFSPWILSGFVCFLLIATVALIIACIYRAVQQTLRLPKV